jgi:predicted RNase H-like nuclease (RuvC/YqgF family)
MSAFQSNAFQLNAFQIVAYYPPIVPPPEPKKGSAFQLNAFQSSGFQLIVESSRREIEIVTGSSLRDIINRHNSEEEPKQRPSKEVKRAILRVAKRIDTEQLEPTQAIDSLKYELSSNNEQWRDFYANLLAKAQENIRNAEIRRLMLVAQQEAMARELARQREDDDLAFAFLTLLQEL